MQYIINTKGQVIYSASKAGWFDNGQGRCFVQVNGKFGFIDTSGKIVIPCIYDSVWHFENDAAIVMKDGKYGLINKDGKVLVPLQFNEYDAVPLPHDGKVCYNIGNDDNREYRCVDLNGNLLFTQKALVPFEFSEGYASVWLSYEEGYCVIDEKGDIVIPANKYEYVSSFHLGVAEVSKGNKRGFIGRRGEVIVPIIYNFFYGDSFPVQAAYLGDRHGYIDARNGNVIIPVSIVSKDDYASRYISDNMVCIRFGENKYFYNLDDCTVIDCSEYKDVFAFSEGLCAVTDKKTGKLGFIDMKGSLAIPCVFDEPLYCYSFHGGTCAMGNSFINKQGKVLFSIPRGNKISFERGCYVWRNYSYPNVEKLLDLNGEVKYSGFRIESVGSEFPVAVKKENKTGNEKWGFIDKNGRLVIPYQFNETYIFQDGFATIDEPIRNASRSSSSGSRPTTSSSSNGGCYIATAVYGSYDCPEVWTLRRYRDNTLDRTLFGRLFIQLYYLVSPSMVKWFGRSMWFKSILRKPLDRFVNHLLSEGIENTPYTDKY